MADVSPEDVTPLVALAHGLVTAMPLVAGSADPVPAWSRLVSAEAWLHDVRLASLTAPPEAAKAAEWLLDNDYRVHRALRQIRQDLPPNFYRRLPAIRAGNGTTPRIFRLAHELLRATRLQVTLSDAVRFLRAVQEGQPLSTAELWAFPTMLRIACIEILVSALGPLLGQRVRAPFEISEWGVDPASLDATERVARAIANLSLISAIPWVDFFDQTSRVEEVLQGDPSGFYAHMDFESRDRYRRAVEEIAQWASASELAVAEAAIARAQTQIVDSASAHVGYWLVDEGRVALEQGLAARIPRSVRLARAALGRPGRVYALALGLCAAGALLLPALYLLSVGASLGQWLASLVLTLIPASILAITLVHWAITRLVRPRVLNKLDCSKGLPADCRTIVVIPAVLRGAEEVPWVAEQMESHWLGNRDPALQVALLADPADAAEQRLTEDAVVERALTAEIERLNRRHASGGVGPFHLLVRPRQLNASEGCWMAWERKRGKLEQFNRMLIERDDKAFSLRVGNRAALDGTRFVITVDADTMLPPESVAKLVGALAHPLNRPSFDPGLDRPARGYSIIQPRVEISPQSGRGTLFARLFTGDTSIDIYSRAVSDVYQDLFGAGIFVGKGIYDLHAFHRSVDGRVPENSILSHDLFEGAHGRVALATDITLYEGFPASYLEYARRLQRWIRGDWQLVPWLGRTVPAAADRRIDNDLTGLDRWKILDNLRRSLVAPALLTLALGGWLLLPGDPLFWTALVLFAPAGQIFTDLISGLARGRRRGAVRGALAQLSDQSGRWLLALVFLLQEALLSVQAIAVTSWRLKVSRRHLLEWTSAAHMARSFAVERRRVLVWRQMAPGAAAAALLLLALLWLRPAALPAAAPFLLLWLAAPEISLWIDRPRRRSVEPLTASDEKFLRGLARRTWFYFESFAGPQDKWLPPDNYQGEPHEEIAHRTSPTNIGMMLLSTATAWDLGHVGATELVARTENVLASLSLLERYRGHFYNWYDTTSLQPLEPRYVSTVDSGNLAGALFAYAAALGEAADAPAVEPRHWRGLADVVDLLETALDPLADANGLAREMGTLRDQLKGIEESPGAWFGALDSICDKRVPALEARVGELIERLSIPFERLREIYAWIDRLRHQARAMQRDIGAPASLAGTLRGLSDQALRLAEEMSFEPLYDRERRLFHIGYNVSAARLDPHYYDLLASEARLASFIAIAKGDVPLEHWFHLERPVTRASGGLSLLSWNGSMFEYLMPRLLLRPGPESLLGESERIAVEVQQRYGVRHSLPWGVSESAYSSRDPEHRYRYQAFGVPGLGLRRGLASDMVVSPYASALALAVCPHQATANLKRLGAQAGIGRYGLIEALDFTPERLEPGRAFMPVNAYMAHHQGMILCAIGNCLGRDALVDRFVRDPRLRLVSLLLSERVPREIPSEIERLEALDRSGGGRAIAIPSPWDPAAAPFPQLHLLGNGRLSSWVADSGGGGLAWRGRALTRFVPDATIDRDGLWIYLADEETGALWSATRQPTAAVPQETKTTFHAHLAEFHRRDHDIGLRLEVAVAAGDDVEIRRLSVSNDSDRARRLRITTYGEVVLAPALEDERHPAFSKLFVGGEPVPVLGGLLFTRRARTPEEAPPVLLHFLVDSDGPVEGLGHECDRRAFIGRGRDLRNPQGARQDLSNSIGLTLDPVMSLQLSLDLQPYEHRELCVVTVAAATREAAIEIAERHSSLASLDWAIEGAGSAAASAIDRSRLGAADLPNAQMLASLLVYPHDALRVDAAAVRANMLGQSHLWGMAISGDLPILLLRSGSGSTTMLPELLAAHHHWRRQSLQVDLVILQTAGSAYAEPLREEAMRMLRELDATELLGGRGGVHLLFADQIGADAVRLLEVSAHVVLDESKGALRDQLKMALAALPELPPFGPSLPPDAEPAGDAGPSEPLLCDNGIGGFSPDGREYVIRLAAGERTPAPWCNVLANETFGCLVSEAGGGFSWAVNSGENRLTPWTNDPVTDRPVEQLYLRDEETAAVWTTTPGQAGGSQATEIRHGAGYSRWRTGSHGLDQELLVFVPADAPVKIVRLGLRNRLARHRRITATYYAEWLLGALASLGRRHVHCGYDTASRAILARSSWGVDAVGRVAFLAASLPPHGLTTDRQEFLGREGDWTRPDALSRWGLSGRMVAGADACGAYQLHVELAPDATQELLFVLGQGADETEASDLAMQFCTLEAADTAFEALKMFWDERLSAVEVVTPDRRFDLLVNRWLLYQSLSSRVLARAGFYQASGAFGFRDQLQDVLAMVIADPARARAHILRCAAHQFAEGDVLHWWHPPSDRGVRTRCSDDLLWLPYAVGTYVEATGDVSILREEVLFLAAPPLAAEETDRYARFEPGSTGWPLIDHCARAFDPLRSGRHGLPLIGSGDWNDGFDRVGRGGKGESVWLAWFAAVTAMKLAGLYERLGQSGPAELWRDEAADFVEAAEKSGWDGGWYRRAYDDEGRPLGAAEGQECRIDSICQSWAAFAGAEPARVSTALEAAGRELLSDEDQLARLLWPPFEHAPFDPGYIKAYPPGVRENGGQYSHAAAWLGIAFAQAGDAANAYRLFEMLNPIARTPDRSTAEQYRLEPYVVAGDIAAAPPHVGKGGWSWYTGAAAWTWRLGVETVLGLRLNNDALEIEPCLPPGWRCAAVTVRRGGSAIRLNLEDPEGVGRGELALVIDGQAVGGRTVSFPAAGKERIVTARVVPRRLDLTGSS